MGHTEIVPEGPALQRPSDNTHYMQYIKQLRCAVAVLAALCIVVIGVLSWHITQTVHCQGQEITPKLQESIQAITKANNETMKYVLSRYEQLQDTNRQTAKILESQEAVIRSLQFDMQRNRQEVEAQGNIIAIIGDKIEKANETISICTDDIGKLKADTNGFAENLINLQELSNANVNVLQKLQEDFDVHTDNITSLQKDSKTCLDEVESLLKELQMNGNDLETKTKNLTDEVKPMHCEDLSTTNISAKSGVFMVYPTSNFLKSGLPVYCDMSTQDGGWIVIQRRQDGSEDFNLGWQEYKSGFGKLNSEFWLGLDNIHALVSNGKLKLLINMRDSIKGEKYAVYKTFLVGPESGGFVLTIDDYSGDAGDSLTQHNGMMFSTKDKDNDRHSGNCAVDYTGAWWYTNCHSSNLNGVYGSTRNKGPRWKTFTGQNPVEFVEMKIKQKM